VKNLRKLIIALLVVFAFSVADVAFTVVGLSLGGSELNPFFRVQGFQTALLIKLGFPLIALVVYPIIHGQLETKFPNYTKVVWGITYFMIAFYSFVLVNNVMVVIALAST
jgi:hypothetical protein